MKQKILATTIIGLIIFSSIITISYSTAEAQNILNEPEDIILQQIAQTTDKTLTVDKNIGDRHVKYWEHMINDVTVKNDSILLHLDPTTGEILEYQKTWTDIKIDFLDREQKIFKTYQNYLWRKKVVFPDENDTIRFCTFYTPVEYPLMCWEVRYTDGTTIFYNYEGLKIGHSVPTPWSEALVIEGYGDPDYWHYWRGNAQDWFQKWCDTMQSRAYPDLSWVSERISDPDVDLFYVIAHSHGQPDRFLVQQGGVYYNATRLHNDMSGREPIKLAVLCCCSAMEDTGPGTLSYEFRKGQTKDTVTIGYYDMGSCPDFWDTLDWQDFMFKKIHQGYKAKKAFDLACANYPKVEPYVKFVGDENLRIKNTPPETYIYVHKSTGRYIGPYTPSDPPTPNRQDLELKGRVGKWYTFKAKAPILHPFWPDTNDPTPDGKIVEREWKQTVVKSYTNVEIQQISQGQTQNQVIDPMIGSLDFIEESRTDSFSFRWNQPGTYKITLTAEDDDGATSSTTITMHITRIFVNEQIRQFQTRYLTR